MATIVIGSDKPGNVLDSARLELLRSLLAEVCDDDSIRVLILTGEGNATFSNGVDVEAAASLDDGQLETCKTIASACAGLIDSFPKPVIGAINGRAAGLGLELALACHIRLAAPNASFTVSELDAGFPPVCGFTPRIGRLIGKSRALELMLAGGALGASRALELGVVNRIEEGGSLITSARDLARDIARSAPLAIRFALEINRRADSMEFDQLLSLETERFSECFSSEDMREGVRAFLEKRSPTFKGR